MHTLRGYYSQLSPRVKVALILGFIVCVGAWLRLSAFESLTRFNADQVRDALVIDRMFEGDFPLLGPKAGGTTFHLGPAFYYLEYASAVMFGQDPAGIALFIPILGVASIVLFFILFRIYFSSSVTIFLTLLYAVSFYAIRYSRFAWNPNAVPFFLFAFLLLLLMTLRPDTTKRSLWYALLGIVMGIGMQLHTTLLLIMPILFFITHIQLLFRQSPFPLKPILGTIGIVLLCHAPFIAHDIAKPGENLMAFLQGTEKKTEASSSLIQNMFANTAFFLQGSAYVLTGIEPQKNWLRIPKLFSSANWLEITLLCGSIALFLSGLILLIRRLRDTVDVRHKYFLLLLLTYSGVLFLLFLPIAPELNLRFFIVIIFLPFLFLGLIAEALMKQLQSCRWAGLIVLGIVTSILITSNMVMYQKTYTLDERERASLYGGISLGEATLLTHAIQQQAALLPHHKLVLRPFEFRRSIIYLAERSGLSLESTALADIQPDTLLFSIVWNSRADTHETQYTCCYDRVHRESLGRFTLFAWQPKMHPGATTFLPHPLDDEEQ